MRNGFVLFGPSHLFLITLAVLAPIALGVLARRRRALDRPIRIALAALLAGGWLGWYAWSGALGWLTLANALPLNLCDWAALALIVALICPRQIPYELGYFWGLGGSLQGLVTPTLAWGFPDPQFIFFFVNHAGIVTSLLYLSFTGFRPHPASLPRVAAATIGYALVAGFCDYLLGVNYGFLAAKPGTASIMDFLSPWPWYVPELVAIGILSLFVYYIPFWLMDLAREKTTAKSPAR